MKKRYLYSILFGIPGLVISMLAAFVFYGFILGVLWIFVFGDNPWPSSLIGTILPVSFGVIFLTVWIATIIVGFAVGKRLEHNPLLNWGHILLSVVLTLLPVLFIVMVQLRVGNLGPVSDGERCSNYCTQQGYSASSMPPLNSGDRTCSCLDNFGAKKIKVPLDSLK